jgi:hypothetical protein
MSIKIAGLSSLINPPMVFLLLYRVDICAIMKTTGNMWSKWGFMFYGLFVTRSTLAILINPASPGDQGHYHPERIKYA